MTINTTQQSTLPKFKASAQQKPNYSGNKFGKESSAYTGEKTETVPKEKYDRLKRNAAIIISRLSPPPQKLNNINYNA